MLTYGLYVVIATLLANVSCLCTDGDLYYIDEYKTQQCQQVECGPESGLFRCPGDSSHDRCEECKEGYFQAETFCSSVSHYAKQACAKHTPCTPGGVIKVNGTKRSDNICECDWSQCFTGDYYNSVCFIWRECPAGMTLTSSDNRNCQNCAVGTYKNFSGCGSCVNCTLCHGGTIVENCTRYNDTVCNILPPTELSVTELSGGYKALIVICVIVVVAAVIIGSVCWRRGRKLGKKLGSPITSSPTRTVDTEGCSPDEPFIPKQKDPPNDDADNNPPANVEIHNHEQPNEDPNRINLDCQGADEKDIAGPDLSALNARTQNGPQPHINTPNSTPQPVSTNMLQLFGQGDPPVPPSGQDNSTASTYPPNFPLLSNENNLQSVVSEPSEPSPTATPPPATPARQSVRVKTESERRKFFEPSEPCPPATPKRLMCEKYAKRLRDKGSDIIYHMKTEPAFLASLRVDDTLTLENIKEIDNLLDKRRQQKANSRLLELIESKDDSAFELFIKSLVRDRQNYLAELLDAELCEKYRNEFAKSETGLSELDRQALGEAYSSLVGSMRCDQGLISRFLQPRGFLSLDNVERIEKDTTSSEKNYKFLAYFENWLDRDALNKLIKGLDDTRQEHLAQLLREKRAACSAQMKSKSLPRANVSDADGALVSLKPDDIDAGSSLIGELGEEPLPENNANTEQDTESETAGKQSATSKDEETPVKHV